MKFAIGIKRNPERPYEYCYVNLPYDHTEFDLNWDAVKGITECIKLAFKPDEIQKIYLTHQGRNKGKRDILINGWFPVIELYYEDLDIPFFRQDFRSELTLEENFQNWCDYITAIQGVKDAHEHGRISE